MDIFQTLDEVCLQKRSFVLSTERSPTWPKVVTSLRVWTQAQLQALPCGRANLTASRGTARWGEGIVGGTFTLSEARFS